MTVETARNTPGSHPQTDPTPCATTGTRKAAISGPSDPARTQPAALPHQCGCGARWAGANTAHCGAQCHRNFSGVTTFDRHRTGGACHDPASLGMSRINGRRYEVWGYPDVEAAGGVADHA